jgi:hypothetical protein
VDNSSHRADAHQARNPDALAEVLEPALAGRNQVITAGSCMDRLCSLVSSFPKVVHGN